MLTYQIVDTPVGPLSLVVSRAGALRAAGFTADPTELFPLMHHQLVEPAEPADDVGPAADAARAYFDGDLAALDDVVVEQRIDGTFVRHAWVVMREIKPGAPVTYSEFARLAGRAPAIRAAAAACARNAVALFVPCHRVLRLDGSLGGYRWGLPVKQFLLDHEAGER